MTDGRGVPLGAIVTPGQHNECSHFEAAMNTLRIARRRRPDVVAGDKAYSSHAIRAWCARRGIEAVIPMRSDQPRACCSRRKYRRRNAVERRIGWLKRCRRIATRQEQLATSFLTMAKLVMTERCPRRLDAQDVT